MNTVSQRFPYLSLSLICILLLPTNSRSLSLSSRSGGEAFIGCSGVDLGKINYLTKMNRCAYEQRNTLAAYDERKMKSVVCPKPRRLGILNSSIHDQFRPSCHINSQTEISDSKAGTELLDIILSKGSYGGERSGIQAAISPPFFSGSPPSRASNPLIQDAQFGNNKFTPFFPPPPSPSSSSSSARKGGGCARMKLGNSPAPVRIEGFDCLSRDGRNCSISAVA